MCFLDLSSGPTYGLVQDGFSFIDYLIVFVLAIMFDTFFHVFYIFF